MHCCSVSAESLRLSIYSLIDMQYGFSEITSWHEGNVFYVLDSYHPFDMSYGQMVDSDIGLQGILEISYIVV